MKGLKRLSFWTTVMMLIVVLGGALVTKTGSGEECGKTWPLCHGKFVPAYTIGSLIEYSHRFVSAIVGIMIVVLFIWVFVKLRERKDAKLFAAAAFVLTFVQAGLGAGAVVWSQSDLVMALHFGISLLAFASTLMLTITIMRIHMPADSSGWGEKLVHQVYLPSGYRWLVWSTLIYTYIVVYTGAYVRHADAINGCLGWPLCNGAVIPELSGASGINFFHRFASLLLLLLVIWLHVVTKRKYGELDIVRKSVTWTLWLTVAQIISGGFIVMTLRSENWLVLTSLIHSVIISGLFGLLCYLSFIVWRMGMAARRELR